MDPSQSKGRNPSLQLFGRTLFQTRNTCPILVVVWRLSLRVKFNTIIVKQLANNWFKRVLLNTTDTDWLHVKCRGWLSFGERLLPIHWFKLFQPPGQKSSAIFAGKSVRLEVPCIFTALLSTEMQSGNIRKLSTEQLNWRTDWAMMMIYFQSGNAKIVARITKLSVAWETIGRSITENRNLTRAVIVIAS